MNENAQNTVRLLVNGSEYAGWKKVSITAGIERQARDFSLEVTDRWPEMATVVRRIIPGDLCEVYIGADKILTGYVDGTPISYDASQITVGVKGRSKTADLVDCSAINKPGQWKGQNLEKIVQELAKPYGIKVISQSPTGAIIPDHQIQQGESAFESIDRLLRLRHLLATDDADGNLILLTAGNDGTATPLLLGGENGNILTGSADLDFKDRYSKYICKGQQSGTDDVFGQSANQQTATTDDTTIVRSRVLVIKQCGQADEGTCRDRVDYERASRTTKSLMATYSVQGWRQANGDLWLPNKMVRVTDTIIGFERQMLISEVQYTLSESGTITTLTMGPREGFIASPSKKKKGKKGGGGDSWSNLELNPDEGDEESEE